MSIYGEDECYDEQDFGPDLCCHDMYEDCGPCEYYIEDECTYPSYEYMEITLKQLFQYSIMHKGILHGIIHALKELFVELYHQIHFKLRVKRNKDEKNRNKK